MLNIQAAISDHIATTSRLHDMAPLIWEACQLTIQTLRNGNKVLLAGNGGSAADAQHLAAELVGRFKAERVALPAIALTTDTSVLTALANDYGYELVFARQLAALGREGDLFIGISTSGNSPNILQAMEYAQTAGIRTIALLGKDGGALKHHPGLSIVVPSQDTARIQEMHILIGHILCEAIDHSFNS